MPPELAPYFAAVEKSKADEAAAQAAVTAAQQVLATATAQKAADVKALKDAVAALYPDA